MGLTCEECGMEIAEGDAFCGECGASVVRDAETAGEVPLDPTPNPAATPQTEVIPPGQVACPACHRGVDPGERFCPWCGVEVQGDQGPDPSQGSQGQAGERVAAAFSQGGGELSDRFQRAWSDSIVRAPLIFLGLMTIGFLIPIASLSVSSGEFLGSGSVSFTLADLTQISVILFLLVSVGLLALLVAHSSSPDLGSWPVLLVAGIAFVLAVIAIILAILTLALGAGVDAALQAAKDGADGASDVFDAEEDIDSLDVSFRLGLGGILYLVGSVGLFVTSLRLYSRDS